MSSNVDSAETQTVVKKQKKQKPARKQVKPGEVEKKEAPQTGKEYNIWYNKWAGGDREDSYSNKTKSQTRCNIRKDSGLTRADTTGVKYCCLFFSRGCCPYGWECEYLHTLPDASKALPDTSKDCFARDKFSDYRDDMGGVGSFTRQNRTLYIGRIKETGTGVETEEVVRRHFKEWGEIEKIRVLQYRSVAFVTYVSESHAQFAKEAMACQSLDNDEILNVRWATEDPNPVSKVTEKQRLEEIGREAIQARMDPRIVDAMRAVRALEDGDGLDDEEETVDGEGEAEPQAKRRRLEIEDARDTPPEVEPVPKQEQPQQPTGLLSADTLEGLKYFAEIRKRNALANNPVKVAAVPPPRGLGLADYGSDDE
ncbi:Pre-mRNA-splicing factor CWC2 [Sparassis crispa]|uniref:Pre-mRNA-splicing factor CWC2 n=1 Tax=Sparassis crispa TaxID=139825 RepID=A0A401H0L5_9APHY|nr:Pre-mRNA-splicing factor CWC2 [Sparassis crispa]GBE87929.1 Pre-mRNA-splicing factor CWC2 [Sparassis crispa]